MAKIFGQLEKAQLENLASNPSSPPTGYIYFNTTTNRLRYFTGTSWREESAGDPSTIRLDAIYPVVLGSPADVTAGKATHSTWASAIAALSAGEAMRVLPGAWTENVTINKKIHIEGSGHGTQLNGTLTFGPLASNASVRQLRVMDHISFDASCQGAQLEEFWIASGKTVTDDGNNYVRGWEE